MKEENGGALSVGELTRRIKTILEQAFPELWVRGEISNLRIQPSGHAYFTLKDESAKISAAMFKGDLARTGTPLRDGMKIAAFGRVTVYEPGGAYQLVVRAAMDDGEGRLRREYEALKSRLAAEGLFDASRKRPIPSPVRKLAVITSPTGAALRDFVSVLQRRGWFGELTLFPSRVQGAGAAAEVAAQLKKTSGYDLVVVTRGGGSLEDLRPFNEEIVARAVAACATPVISAVGHEIDFSLCDFAADLRAETPTAAAELISSAHLTALLRLEEAEGSLHTTTRAALESLGHRLARTEARLRQQAPELRLERNAGRIAAASAALDRIAASGMTSGFRKLDRLSARLAALSPESRFRPENRRLSEMEDRMRRAITRHGENSRARLDNAEARLRAAGIETTLRRGFSIITNDHGKIITGRAGVKDGAPIRIRFGDGEAEATGGRSLF